MKDTKLRLWSDSSSVQRETEGERERERERERGERDRGRETEWDEIRNKKQCRDTVGATSSPWWKFEKYDPWGKWRTWHPPVENGDVDPPAHPLGNRRTFGPPCRAKHKSATPLRDVAERTDSQLRVKPNIVNREHSDKSFERPFKVQTGKKSKETLQLSHQRHL